MSLRNKKRELHGVVGALGVVVALFGFVGGVISAPITIALTFSIWILGAVLVNLYCAPPGD